MAAIAEANDLQAERHAKLAARFDGLERGLETLRLGLAASRLETHRELDALRVELKSELAAVRSEQTRQRALLVPHQDLERRMNALETGFTELRARVEQVEERHKR